MFKYFLETNLAKLIPLCSLATYSTPLYLHVAMTVQPYGCGAFLIWVNYFQMRLLGVNDILKLFETY
jgi:hypothetical protein